MVNDAMNFMMKEVFEPALNSHELSNEFKNKVRVTKNLFRKFRKTGDMFKYLERFNEEHGTGNDELYLEMKKLELKTFEDIYPVFKEKFKYEIEDITVLDDFIIGKEYNSYDIAIFSKTYNLQSGIYLIGEEPNYQAIFIKATLENGNYPNEWIVEDEELKYYMFASKNNYDPTYKYNRAIINSKNIPIYVFIKNDLVCKLVGVFKYIEYNTEKDDSKWFRLKKLIRWI